jgi:hypothetical protein
MVLLHLVPKVITLSDFFYCKYLPEHSAVDETQKVPPFHPLRLRSENFRRKSDPPRNESSSRIPDHFRPGKMTYK